MSALDSPLLYGSDISQAKRILFNIYTSNDKPLLVEEMNEIDAFMDTRCEYRRYLGHKYR